jgi:uncharacterized protein YndB with AHSA1/START domain
VKTTEKPVVLEADFNHPLPRLWKALTNRDEMVQWFFENIPEFKAQKGFKTRFSVLSGGRYFEHIWHISEVVPSEKIVYDWSYCGYPGQSRVLFEISGGAASSRLKLTHLVLEDFPDHIPEFQRKSCLKGWEYFIGERLNAFMGQIPD